MREGLYHVAAPTVPELGVMRRERTHLARAVICAGQDEIVVLLGGVDSVHERRMALQLPDELAVLRVREKGKDNGSIPDSDHFIRARGTHLRSVVVPAYLQHRVLVALQQRVVLALSVHIPQEYI